MWSNTLPNNSLVHMVITLEQLI